MANTLLTTSKIAPKLLPEFVVNTALIENANLMLEREFTSGDIYGIGGSIQMRKYPRYTITEQALSNGSLPSGFTITTQDIQQETETLTIESFLYGATNLNAVEQALKLRTDEAFNDFIKNPLQTALKQKVMNFLYGKVVEEIYIFTGTPSSSINTYATVANANALMNDFQMPEQRCLIMSPTDVASFSSSQVSNNFYRESLQDIWRNGLIGMINGFLTYSDNNVVIHLAGTATTDTITLNAAAVDGDTTLSLTGLTIGNTIKVGDKFQIPTTAGQAGADIYYVQPEGKITISNTAGPITFVVAAGASSNTDYDSATRTYTATATTMTVSIKNPVRTAYSTDQYAYISSPTDTLPVGLGLTMLDSHRVSPAFCKGNSLTVAMPPLADLKYGAVSSRATFNSISVQTTLQSDSSTYSNKFLLAGQIGALIHPEYTVGILSAA